MRIGFTDMVERSCWPSKGLGILMSLPRHSPFRFNSTDGYAPVPSR
ncbi:hypothetical protein Z950_3158 [Sulfitobacter mediterraneus KCTC 32188]|nr:hypothetical protein Z950_3158 [Sulfitobacter mediterraneus KCTC 32188]